MEHRAINYCGRAVFRLLPPQDRYKSFTDGSCFVFRDPRCVITAAHVVAESPTEAEWLVLAEHWSASARVLATDVEQDLAVLQLSEPAPAVLKASDHSGDAGDALVAWDWPDSSNHTGRAFCSQTYAQLRVPPLSSDTRSRIAFVGHVRKGMSGGPLVSSASGAVQGVIVNARPTIDEHEIVDCWWSHAQSDWQGTDEEENILLACVRAQLALGLGFATPIDDVLKFLSLSRVTRLL